MEASIVYKAHCSVCGALINEEVNFKKISRMYDAEITPYRCDVEITPYRCKACGAYFSKIEIRLPQEQKTIIYATLTHLTIIDLEVKQWIKNQQSRY